MFRSTRSAEGRWVTREQRARTWPLLFVLVRDFLAARMLLEANSPQRRQLEYSTHALIQTKVPNPSPARAPSDRSGVKRAGTGSELLHEPDFVFPRPSHFSRYFHPAERSLSRAIFRSRGARVIH